MAKANRSTENIYISPAPAGLEEAYEKIFTDRLIKFLYDLVCTFEKQINEVYEIRKKPISERLKLERYEISEKEWTVDVDEDEINRDGVILGDISPSNIDRFISTLKAHVNGAEVDEDLLQHLNLSKTEPKGKVCGLQIDFDDGHCPTWRNQIESYYNIYKLYKNEITEVPITNKFPHGLIFRVRAFNMPEYNVRINNVQVPGGIVDFAVMFFHTYAPIVRKNGTLHFQIPKVETLKEVELYQEIFRYTEDSFICNSNSFKVSVLIETAASVFYAEHIIHVFRKRLVGLVCGMWDFCASILNNYNDDSLNDSTGPSELVTAERNSWNSDFLTNYLRFVVNCCNKRKTVAIGGMDPTILRSDSSKYSQAEKVCSKKLHELKIGVETLMVYDTSLVCVLGELRKKYKEEKRQQTVQILETEQGNISQELFKIPIGQVSQNGLKETMEVSIFFVYNWLCSNGLFIRNDKVEDSATAEICLRQLRQWLKQKISLTNKKLLSFDLLRDICEEIQLQQNIQDQKLELSKKIVLDLITRRDCDQYITTILYEQWIVRDMWQE